MSNVISLVEKKFERVNAGKIVAMTDAMDDQFRKLCINDDVPASEVIVAMAHRIGVYLGVTDADKEDIVKRLAKIIYKRAKAAP